MNFKKIMAMLMIGLCMSVAFTGCSKSDNKSARESSSDEDDEEEDEEEEKEEKSSKKNKKKKKKDDSEKEKEDDRDETGDTVYESELIEQENEYEGSYSLQYRIVLHEDGTADYYETNYSAESNYDYTTHMSGEYNADNDIIELLVPYNGNVETLKVYLEGTAISEVEYVYDAGVGDIAGETYSCDDTEIGPCSFEVFDDGSVTMTGNDRTYTGYLSKFEDEWNLMVSDDSGEESESLDWIVYIDGNEFTYVPYRVYIYGDYQGEFEAFGQFGDAMFIFNEDGTASTDMKIDGKKKHFEGNYYVNSEEGRIGSAYMTSEDGTTLDISFDEVDGMMNYHGSYMVPLAAG